MILNKFKPGFWILIIVATALYVLTRLNPLLTHQVSYTYDQGRDFLVAAEIIDDRNLPFIGPTTGIIGLFYGAWWYYLLAVPYLIFKGLPISFYYFNALIHLLSLWVLAIFTYLEFGFIVAFFAVLVVVSSPYFTASSLFVGNNIMAIPSMLAFCISLYYLIKPKLNKKTLSWLFFLNGLALGFVSEFELSFGLFLIPSYFFTITLFSILKQKFLKLMHWLRFMIGLGITLLPRILFEIKHGFSQTKILLSFFLQPKLHNPKPLLAVFKDRMGLFQDYYNGSFNSHFLNILISITLAILIINLILKKQLKSSINIFFVLISLLFGLSLFYKDNFWGNYYEGIQYLFLLLIILIFSQSKTFLFKLLLNLTNLFIITAMLIKVFTPQASTSPAGLAAHEKVVEYIYQQHAERSLINIYTPPAIPYTYRYLFYYQHRFHQKPLPTDQWQNNLGWYIIEHDDFADRKQDWLNTRIPQDAKLIKNKKISDIEIQLWKK